MKCSPGPLFLVEKMSAGFGADGGDWRYTLMMPNGQVFGVTGEKGSSNVAFCKDCHIAVGEDFIRRDFFKRRRVESEIVFNRASKVRR